MTATFCGHAQISQSADVEKWLYAVTLHLIEQGVNIFYLGGYGAFDSLAAAVLRKQKIQHPEIELILVLAYFDTKRDISGYDSTVYLEVKEFLSVLPKDLEEIARLLYEGFSAAEIARLQGVNRSTISRKIKKIQSIIMLHNSYTRYVRRRLPSANSANKKLTLVA